MEKVGAKSVVYSKEFIVPDGEEIYFDTHAEGWLIKVKVIFLNEPDKNDHLDIIPEGDILKIKLTNWKNSIGTATVTPIRIGTHNNGKYLYAMFANYAVGKTNIFHIQLLMGDPDGK